MKRSKLPTIDTSDFGHVECPILVDQEKGRLETYLVYGIKDLISLVNQAALYYAIKRTKIVNKIDFSKKLPPLSVGQRARTFRRPMLRPQQPSWTRGVGIPARLSTQRIPSRKVWEWPPMIRSTPRI